MKRREIFFPFLASAAAFDSHINGAGPHNKYIKVLDLITGILDVLNQRIYLANIFYNCWFIYIVVIYV